MDNIKIKKVWEDSEFFEANICFCSNKLITDVDIYITSDIIKNISKTIISFLEGKKGPCFFEIGEKKDDYPYICLNFKKIDLHGNSVMDIYIEYYSEDFENRFYCFFPLYIEHGLLYTFGKKINKLNQIPIDEEISVI